MDDTAGSTACSTQFSPSTMPVPASAPMALSSPPTTAIIRPLMEPDRSNGEGLMKPR